MSSIGELDAIPTLHILSAAKQAIDQGKHGYIVPPGIQECRSAVSRYIGDQYNVELDSERIIVFVGGKVTINFANLLLGQLENFMLFQMFSGLRMDGITAQNELLEDFGVATIAGTSFGQRAKNNIRLSFAASDKELDEALIKNIRPGLHRKAVSTWSKASSFNNSGKLITVGKDGCIVGVILLDEC